MSPTRFQNRQNQIAAAFKQRWSSSKHKRHLPPPSPCWTRLATVSCLNTAIVASRLPQSPGSHPSRLFQRRLPRLNTANPQRPTFTRVQQATHRWPVSTLPIPPPSTPRSKLTTLTRPLPSWIPSRLPLMELAYNATGVDSIDGYSPFFLDHLRECVLPMDSMTEPPPKQAPSDLPEWVSRMLEDQRIVYDASSKSLRLHALHAKRR